MVSLLILSLLTATDTTAPDTVVVCPPPYSEALQPWLQYRRSQGHTIAVVEDVRSADIIRAAIRKYSQLGQLRFVVLVGDATQRTTRPAEVEIPNTPTLYLPAEVNIHWGSEPKIASDNGFGDLNDDRLPDLAVGRLSVASPAQLTNVIRKIVAYESIQHPGTWQRQLNFVAGVGGFGRFLDSILETTTKKFLTDAIPAAYSISMTYGSWRSPFCPDPRRFRETTIDRLNEGCLFWVYMGHGQRRFLDRIRVPGAAFPILDTDDVPKLRSREQSPIALFLSCYAGAYDEPRDCLAELMLRSADGPVAVVAGSRVTMPYGMAVMGNELMREYFHSRRPTLGELLMFAKRRMAAESSGEPADLNRQMVDAIASIMSPAANQLERERIEHVLLFNLLGDPLLRLPHAAAAKVVVPPETQAGQPVAVSWDSPIPGQATIELVCRRDRMKRSFPARAQFQHVDQLLRDYTTTYRSANDRCWVRESAEVVIGTGEITLDVPPDSRGPCFVRVFVDGGEQTALGAAAVFVRRRAKSAEEAGPAPTSPQN